VTEFTAVVTDIRLESQIAGVARWQISLDETAFEPGDTGMLEAVTPSGVSLAVPVLEVVVDDDRQVWHVVQKPLGAGTAVTGRVGE
jgi:hypothetical protein